MTMKSLLAHRRDGVPHTREEIAFLCRAAEDPTTPDYQLAAWLMAAYLRPLDAQQTAWLTLEMADGGDRIDLSGLPRPWVDKHSTGGVGDKTTLVLLPLLAACGLTLVKMSGRGLGITGGTLDKLESVPGFRTELAPEELKAQAARIGLAITGAGRDLAPADRVLYGLRDATETVRSVPLIVSSILSKKIAGGAETVVLDVKCGSGAFMRDLAEARALASALESTAEHAGLKVRTAITDMDQPLGAAVGNLLEVAEAMELLGADVFEFKLGPSPSTDRFRELCLGLAAQTLEAAGVAATREEGLALAQDALASGAAAAKAVVWLRAQGADLDLARQAAPAEVVRPVAWTGEAGWVRRFDAAAVGQAALLLGAGRETKEDQVDHKVGVVVRALVGDRLEPGQVLANVYADGEAGAAEAAEAVLRAVEPSPTPVEPNPLFLG